MALTLLEGNKYSTTELDRVVIDRLVKDDQILLNLPFESLLGNSLTYDTITTRSGASFYSVGDTWTESTPSLTQATVTLKILGGDADVDNFLLATRSNKIDLQGTVLEDKILAVKEKFLDTFVYGSATVDVKQFNGLQLLLTDTTYNTVHAGTGTGSAATIAKMRECVDLITGWNGGTHILMSKKMRRLMATYLDSVGATMPRAVNTFGKTIDTFDGKEIIVSDHIVNTELAATGKYSAKTGGNTTSMYFLTFAPQALSGVQGSEGIKTVPIGELETKDATRHRIKWYCGLKFENIRSCAKFDGIKTTSAVTA